MKHACIVIRDKQSYLNGNEFEPVVAALIDGGYAPDQILLVPDDDMHLFAQTLTDCKNFFNTVFVIGPGEVLPMLRLRVCEMLKAVIPQGCLIEKQKKFFVCLPYGTSGRDMVCREVIDSLDAKYSVKHDRMVVRAVGTPTERLQNVVREAVARSNGKLTFHVEEKHGDQRIEVSYDDTAPKMLVDDVMRFLAGGLNDHLYAVEDTSLPLRIVQLLQLRGLRLSIAESFTGGGVAQQLISVPGASKVLFEGIVAYDNGSKMHRLGVQATTLQKQGAVSDEVAYEMAAGLLSSGGCDVSLSTTGIAGPQSDNTGKPVGLCYIAVGTKASIYVYKYVYQGSREEISRRAVNQALFLLYKQLK